MLPLDEGLAADPRLVVGRDVDTGPGLGASRQLHEDLPEGHAGRIHELFAVGQVVLPRLCLGDLQLGAAGPMWLRRTSVTRYPVD